MPPWFLTPMRCPLPRLYLVTPRPSRPLLPALLRRSPRHPLPYPLGPPPPRRHSRTGLRAWEPESLMDSNGFSASWRESRAPLAPSRKHPKALENICNPFHGFKRLEVQTIVLKSLGLLRPKVTKARHCCYNKSWKAGLYFRHGWRRSASK